MVQNYIFLPCHTSRISAQVEECKVTDKGHTQKSLPGSTSPAASNTDMHIPSVDVLLHRLLGTQSPITETPRVHKALSSVHRNKGRDYRHHNLQQPWQSISNAY